MDLEEMRQLGQQLRNHHQEVSRCPHHELASRLTTAEMEIEGLKEEIEELQCQLEAMTCERDAWEEECDELITDRYYLKQELSGKQDYIDKLECGEVIFECSDCHEYTEEIKRLQEENQRLTERIKTLV